MKTGVISETLNKTRFEKKLSCLKIQGENHFSYKKIKIYFMIQ